MDIHLLATEGLKRKIKLSTFEGLILEQLYTPVSC